MPDSELTDLEKWRRTRERFDEHDGRLHHLETTSVLHTERLAAMAPKVEMLQVEQRLEKRLDELTGTVKVSGEQTQSQIRELVSTLRTDGADRKKSEERQQAINEEMMRDIARRAEEKHLMELEAERAKTAAIEAKRIEDAKRREQEDEDRAKKQKEEADEREAKKLDKQIVRWGGVVSALSIMGVAVWWVFQFASSHLPPEAMPAPTATPTPALTSRKP